MYTWTWAFASAVISAMIASMLSRRQELRGLLLSHRAGTPFKMPDGRFYYLLSEEEYCDILKRLEKLEQSKESP